MSDDEADPSLLEFLRQHLQGKLSLNSPDDDDVSPDTGVLTDAEWVYDHGAIDVALDMRSCKAAAELIYTQMQQRGYSPATWVSAHELHPDPKMLGEGKTVAFIFVMDLLNFSFWSEKGEEERFAVEYKGRRWTGYWSLVAGLRRALDEGIPITDPYFWTDDLEFTVDTLRQVFRSCTDEEMPLLTERFDCLREAGQVLCNKYDADPLNLVKAAKGSATRLVNLLARDFSCFRDEHNFEVEGRTKRIRIMKRAQILVADLWACFEGAGPGEFRDIDKITMFADYRVPQILNSMNCLIYSPTLEGAIKDKKEIASGSSWEIQLRACSIWCVELIRREILRQHPGTKINAVLIDFYLYDAMKEMEAQGKERLPHHRTRSIWY